jgi:hypothetical protein
MYGAEQELESEISRGRILQGLGYRMEFEVPVNERNGDSSTIRRARLYPSAQADVEPALLRAGFQ